MKRMGDIFTPRPFVAAILLAAGKSSRMGAFKPLLPFGNRSVVEACVSNLLEGGVDEVVVVVGHRAREVQDHLAHLPVRFAVNNDSASEMGVSIMRGIEQVSTDAEALLLALVDQPAVPPGVISFLVAERERTRARLIVPVHEGRGGHPVLIDLSFREELLNLDQQRGLRGLFDAHREEVMRVAVASPYVALDMDRWDDYRALYREVFGTEPENSRQ